MLLLDNVTRDPPAGAGTSSDTVPVEELPPVMLVGFRFRVRAGVWAGLTVSVAVCDAPYVAVIVAAAEEETALVVTANVAVAAPAGMRTLGGT